MSEPQNKHSSFRYISDRVAGGMFFGGLFGVVTGYYAGEVTAMRGYTMALSGAGLAAVYFAGVEGLRLARGHDDEINHAISGGITGASFLGLFSSRNIPTKKAVPIGLVVGTVLGVAYKYSSDSLYSWGRETWIKHRYHAKYVSRPRGVRQYTGPRIDLPPHLQGMVPPLPDHLNRYSGTARDPGAPKLPSDDSTKDN